MRRPSVHLVLFYVAIVLIIVTGLMVIVNVP